MIRCCDGRCCFRSKLCLCRLEDDESPAAHGDRPHHSLDHHAVLFALLVSGAEIVISHPRFYWGETGNVLTPSLFDLPIPASRPWVNTGYGFVLPDQNGWSRESPFRSRLGHRIHWLGVCDFRSALHGTSGRTCCQRDAEPHKGGALEGVSRTICASGGQVRQKPGPITSFSGLPTCS